MSSQPECLDCGDSVNHGGIICQDCLTAHDAAIARTATLAENKRVLDVMEGWLKNDDCPPKKKKGKSCSIGCGRCMIKSLRTTAQQEQHP
jgi:hypothetical protein